MILSALCSLAAFQSVAGTSNVGVTKPNALTFPIEQGDVKVFYGETTVYTTLQDPPDVSDGGTWKSAFFYVEVLGAPAVNNYDASVDDARHLVSFASSNPKVIRFTPVSAHQKRGGEFDVLAPGKATVTVSVDGRAQTIPMTVVRLPIRINMKPRVVVQGIGRPTTIRSSLSETKIAHRVGVEYRSVPAQDWLYDRYPGLVIMMDPYDGPQTTDMVRWSAVEKRFNQAKGWEP